MNGKTVELRLVIFRARISYIISQINYDVLADFSSSQSRVDGLHTTPPASYRGEGMKISRRATGEAGLNEGSELVRAGPSRGAA